MIQESEVNSNEYVVPRLLLLSWGNSKNLCNIKEGCEKTIKQWNTLSEEVMCAKNIHSFKYKCDKKFQRMGHYELDSILYI